MPSPLRVRNCKIPAAACAVGCFRLQYAEGVFTCFGVKNAADARGKIRSIRFKAPFAQCGFKASALRNFAGNGVRLVAVGNDGAAVDLPHGGINDKRRVCQLFSSNARVLMPSSVGSNMRLRLFSLLPMMKYAAT